MESAFLPKYQKYQEWEEVKQKRNKKGRQKNLERESSGCEEKKFYPSEGNQGNKKVGYGKQSKE